MTARRERVMDDDSSFFSDYMCSAPRALVGRELELALIRERLTIAAGGNGQVLLLGGEAGIGKTTLLRALATLAEGRDYRALQGACFDLEAPAEYALWRDVWRDGHFDVLASGRATRDGAAARPSGI